MKIGITCYPTYGGSGIVATELGLELATRGHEVHFISYSQPIRLTEATPNIFYHEVEVSRYPLFEYPPYDLALATRMAEIAEVVGLDLLHVHYAIPHSVSAMLARQMLACDNHRKSRKLPYVTTLHGTDITLVGADPSYLPITRFSIEQSDGVTSISQYLARRTLEVFEITHPIKVIPNFVNCDMYHRTPEVMRQRSRVRQARRADCWCTCRIFAPSNACRTSSRSSTGCRRKIPARLMMIGDGPERSSAEWLAVEKGIHDKIDFLGKQDRIYEKLPLADVMLMPSQLESFGLAALEGMACQVVPIATNAGGVPEVIQHGKTGFLAPVGDVEGMAKYAIELLSDQERAGRHGSFRAGHGAGEILRQQDHSGVRGLLPRSAGAGFVKRSGDRAAHVFGQQDGQLQPYQGPVSGLALDGDLGRVAVNHLQALGDIHHADARARRTAGSRNRHADAVVFHLDDDLACGRPAAKEDAAALYFVGQSVLDGVLHQRLQDHAGNQVVERGGVEFLEDLQLLAPEAHHLDIQVVIEELDLFPAVAQKSRPCAAVGAECCSVSRSFRARNRGRGGPATTRNSAC